MLNKTFIAVRSDKPMWLMVLIITLTDWGFWTQISDHPREFLHFNFYG